MNTTQGASNMPAPRVAEESTVPTPLEPPAVVVVETPAAKRVDTDWLALIRSKDEIMTFERKGEKEKEVIPLKVLQKYARQAGWCGTSTHIEQTMLKNGLGAHGSVRALFDDDTEWEGNANVNKSNTEEPFNQYPVATCESVALARALRYALGIFDVYAADEIDLTAYGLNDDAASTPEDPATFGNVDPQQVRVIEKLLGDLNMQPLEMLREVVGGDRSEEICTLEELMADEAAAALAFLNHPDRHKKKQAKTGESLAERKAKLEAEIAAQENGK